MKNARCLVERLKRLPRHHRVAHLRALIGIQPPDGGRNDELSDLLRQEVLEASAD